MRVLCVLGEHQYGDPSRGVGTEYSAFVPALERLGHEVIHFESWNRSRYKNFYDLNQALLDVIEREKPDVLLSVQFLYEIWTETLDIIRDRYDVATVTWTTDDSWKYVQCSRFIGKHYHAISTTYDYMVPRYHQDGIPNVLLTQWAANLHHCREPLPAKECRYQVTFVGAAHGDRAQKVADLKNRGVDVECFGHGWPNGSVSAEDIPRIMRESVISLNFANSKGENQIKARTFEVPGAGGFLLTDSAPGLEKFYRLGEEVVVFDDMTDLCRKVGHYLQHPEERDRIANAGYRRTVEQHTYDRRLKELLEFALAAKAKAAPRSEPRELPKPELGPLHHLLRKLLLIPSNLIFGKKVGPRAARRLLFEVSWRLWGEKTYSAYGLPGRLFYEES